MTGTKKNVQISEENGLGREGFTKHMHSVLSKINLATTWRAMAQWYLIRGGGGGYT